MVEVGGDVVGLVVDVDGVVLMCVFLYIWDGFVWDGFVEGCYFKRVV